MKFNSLLALSLGFSFVSIAQVDPEQKCIDQASTIEQKLRCVRGLTFKETKTPEPDVNYRTFDIFYVQPVNHANMSAGSFKQRLVLLHRNETQPMILQTSGYFIFGIAETEATALFGTNQLQVEHRFFGNSKPNPLNWSMLTVQQSATDFHRITVAFKKIYKARWVNTGASKGGMTSAYHRRFFPNDLDGTLADVAPLSFSKDDPRYIQFVEHVGGEKYRACRAALKTVQIALLKNKQQILPKITGSYTQIGNKEVVFEHAVSELPFIFWQYGNPLDAKAGCQKIPVNGSAAELFAFLQTVNNLSSYTDQSLSHFQPYFFQVATQLGGPGTDRSYLAGLVKYPFSVDQYTPKGVPLSYSNLLMKDVQAWTRNQSNRMMFVYGEFDPWSAAEFPISQDANQRYKFVVPGGNHGSTFMDLPPSHRAAAIRILSVWLNKNPVPASRRQARSLEKLEAEYLRYFKP